MQVESSVGIASEMNFAALLEASFEDDTLERGDIVTGTVLSVATNGLIVGVGTYRDGFVDRRDIERLGVDPLEYEEGQDIDVAVVRMEDDEGNLVLSVSQARQNEDWKKAESLLEADEVWEGRVADANRGGLIMLFGNLRAFVPASHVADLPRGLEDEERQNFMRGLVGKNIRIKVMEVNRKRRRLVFSQRDAERGRREERKEHLLDALEEGETRKGVVSGLRDFGAFVDLGGADGLIHISELAWHRVKHPSEVLNVGDEIEVYILRLDSDGKRIGLSLKRLQPNPWELVDEMYHVGQLVQGTVSRTANFGAFISLDPGIEALLHVSQIAENPPEDATTVIQDGDNLLMRVISIEADKQRLGLSLKEVTAEERQRWEEQNETTLTPVPVDLQDMVVEAVADVVEEVEEAATR